MTTDWTSLGMNEETAKKVWEHLSKSGPAASVGISAALLYFAGTVWSCLGCGPVRTIILTIVAWFSQCFILYSAARQECGAKINSETAGKVAIRALYPTVAFIVGYVIVPWFLPTPLAFTIILKSLSVNLVVVIVISFLASQLHLRGHLP